MRMRSFAVVPLLLLTLSTVAFTAAPAAPADGGDWVDVVVVLHDGEDAPAAAARAARQHRAEVGFVYEHALQGFAARVPAGRLAALQRDTRVAHVEVDAEVSIQQTVPTGIMRASATSNTALDIGGTDDNRVDVDVAVLDTGIDLEHPDLDVVGGTDCTLSSGPSWKRTYSCSETGGTRGDDDHHHGTHVAGTIGAIDNGVGVVGVAPGARLWAVKVLDSTGSGYTSGIVAGIDWVVARGDIEVLNMSLGGSRACTDGSAYDTAIDNAVANGVAVAVAAGNSDMDAKDYSPASCTNAFAVSALADFDGAAGGTASPTCRTDQDDTLADFSNFGEVVDLAAPGVCILSTYPVEKGSYARISGTSMAAPHVAGAFALLASSAPNGPGKGASAVASLYSQVQTTGSLDWTDDSGDTTKERLLDVSTFPVTIVGSVEPGNTAPTAAFTSDCSDLACGFVDSSSDGDGTVTAWRWQFGDATTSTSPSPTHTYAAAGTYTVQLTVTDDDGAVASTSRSVTVTEPTGGGGGTTGVTLTTNPYKVKGAHTVDLTWGGASSVDVYVDGAARPAATTSVRPYTWTSSNKGSGSYTFQVCAAGTSTCSPVVEVVFG